MKVKHFVPWQKCNILYNFTFIHLCTFIHFYIFYSWHLNSPFFVFFLCYSLLHLLYLHWFIFLSHAFLLFFLLKIRPPLCLTHIFLPLMFKACCLMSLKMRFLYNSIAFFSLFLLLVLHLSHSIPLGALVSQNLFRNFWHTCYVALYQLFLVPLAKPGLVE